MNRNEYYMRRAISLALRAKGRTSPNPLVGALVVKNGKVVGSGYHKQAGEPHAEIEAIERAGRLTKRATLYVTLEPCAHYGRTPPCIDKVIGAGFKKVVIGMVDPNPLNNGRGISILRERGIEVETGLLEEDVRKINLPFIKYITKKMPYITVKVGQSLDGKISARGGDSKWITSEKARAFARGLRSNYDAVMVGVNTVLRDDPFLTSPDKEKTVTRIIVDSHLSTKVSANIFSRQGDIIIVTVKVAKGQETENRLLLAGKAKILEVKENNGQVNLHDMLKKLAARFEITNIMVEGGGSLIGSLFDYKLADSVLFFIAPKIIGGKDSVSSVMGRGPRRIDKAVRLKGVKMRKIGEDFLVEGECVY